MQKIKSVNNSYICSIILVTSFAIAIGIVSFFNVYAELDVYISSIFYNDEDGFFLKDNILIWLGGKAPPVISGILSLLIASKAITIHLKTKSFALRHYHFIIFLSLSCIIGPGIMVHHVFKDSFNRPRPRQIAVFGGEDVFQSPIFGSIKTGRHFSFPSGHAAVGYMFCAFGFIDGSRRNVIWGLSIIAGLLFGFVRVVQGAHFLSDVLFSGPLIFFTTTVIYMMYNKFVSKL